jgi:hypothetical protein
MDQSIRKTSPLPIGTQLEHVNGEHEGTIVAYTLNKREGGSAARESGAPWKYRVHLSEKKGSAQGHNRPNCRSTSDKPPQQRGHDSNPTRS